MALATDIEWTEATWNPVTGCTKASAGCDHCYAERLAKRLRACGSPKYADGFEVRLHPQTLEAPYHWRLPRFVFVNSMGDLFHTQVDDDFIRQVWKVMSENPRHTFQLLTKRSERLSLLAPALPWPKNVWVGVTVENREALHRISHLQSVPAVVRFISAEPLLESLGVLDLSSVDWVIVGGESGPGARPLEADWVREIRDQCVREGVPFFFKQWGGRFRRRAGREIDGKTWDQMPPPRSE